MKLKYAVLTLLYCLVSLSFAQQMPIDFDDSNDNFIQFGGGSFAFSIDPQDSNNAVGQFTNNGNDIWEGFFIDLIQPINLSVEQQITLSFYKADVTERSIILKLENGNGPVIEVEQTTSTSGWTQGITFDFANARITGTNNVINATGSYSRIVVFIDGGVSSTGTFLIDDIDDGTQPVDPNDLDVIYEDLVWSDEFDSTTPSPINNLLWHHQTIGPNGGQWFNGEQQHYTDRIDNSFVENGFLNIVAKAETFSQDGVELPYTSARINSKFAFTYGRVDVRAKLPAGNGTWPAIWTLGKNINETGAYWQTQGFGTTSWPDCGELDIMEHGLHDPNEVSCAIHTPSSFGNTVNTETQLLTDVANDFHVYSMNWSPNQITFMIDGVGYYTYSPAVKDSSTWPFDLEQYLILNVALGGFAGQVDTDFTQSSMVVDYVRVYQNILNNDDNALADSSIYPNPTKGVISIRSVAEIDSVEVYNQLGQYILIKEGNVERINLGALKPGLYFIKLNKDGQSITKKIVLQ